MQGILEGRTKMREVKIRCDDLLVKVRENRTKHVKEYDEAVAGYKDAAKDAVQKAMERLQERIDYLEAGEVLVLSAIHFDLKVPQNHAKDYDQVIAMLDMCVDDKLTVRADEFACYVMDDWDWTSEFKNVTQFYNNKR